MTVVAGARRRVLASSWVEDVTALGGAIDFLTVGVVVAGLGGYARYVNSAWLELTGKKDTSWAGLGWFDVLGDAERDIQRDAFTAAAHDGRPYEAIWQVEHPATGTRRLRVCATPTADGGDLAGFVATVSDVTDQDSRTDELTRAATRDPLTGVLNRAYMVEMIRHALDRRQRDQRRQAAVLFVDVDDLKQVNDRWGHGAGDRLLVAAARCIQQALRPADAVARFGGDEFVVLCDDLHDGAEAVAIAERIMDLGGERAEVGMATASLSVGVAFVEAPEDDAESLIARADEAMYRTKQRRRLGSPSVARWHGAVAASDAASLHDVVTPLAEVTKLAKTLRNGYRQMSNAELDDAFTRLATYTSRLGAVLRDRADDETWPASSMPPAASAGRT